MVQRQQAGEDEPPKSGRLSIQDIRDYIVRNYDQPLPIRELAEMAGLSPNYFGELFKKNYGLSPLDYLTEVRLSKAKQYLQESGYLLREIAHKVGYSDEFYFSRKFKKAFGIPPSAFSGRQKRRLAAASAAMTGQLLALGVIPVAAPMDAKWTSFYYNQYYSRIEVHLRADQLDHAAECDKLIRARADAVIGHEKLPAEWREALQQNAVSLFIPGEQDRWDVQLREIAGFIGREAEAERWIADYTGRARRAGAQTEAAGGRVRTLVLRLCGNELYAYCNRGIRDVLYGALGLPSAYASREGLYNERISLQEVEQLNPQRLLLLICPDAATRLEWLALQHRESWRSLTAVQAGAVEALPSDPWFEYSATAMDRMLEEARLIFTGNCPSRQQGAVHG
ncbi:helix-turn-helix domain-containing protein [Paenibacillus tengchongensis]|uniref:helix-turn-helix domain-containing protein n=1 Tax=Paenibacillus tengchongensis TaxID=2608684 RepID=UPI00124D9870|nr:helix-turn-helix domain-containing protein [Paenibacillus tengchongensis]